MFVPSTLPQVELTDLFTGIVAAQRADIFIGAHGGRLAGGWLVRGCAETAHGCADPLCR